tara:strand:+ start:629519 stop:630466 length:948 start_codon:yes stop_codon:yes gene_type:complete
MILFFVIPLREWLTIAQKPCRLWRKAYCSSTVFPRISNTVRTFTPKFFQGSFGGRLLGLVLGIYAITQMDASLLFLLGCLVSGLIIDYLILNYVAPRRIYSLHRQNLSCDIVSLCAKMCKAKGTVEKEDIKMCDRFFDVPAHHRRLVAAIFNDARSDVTGFDLLANRINEAVAGNKDELENVLKVLYAIAYTDNMIQNRERIFLLRVADIFGFSPNRLEAIERELGIKQSAFEGAGEWQQKSFGTKTQGSDNAYATLGLEPGTSVDDVKKAYRKLVAQNHPDKLRGNGASDADVEKAEKRMAEINDAYSQIVKGN